MNFQDFVQGIRFRDLDPMTESIPLAFELTALESYEATVSALNSLDFQVAVIPENHDAYQDLLRPLVDVRRMSTFAIAAIIARSVQGLRPGSAYVNVGIWHGFTLFAGMLGGADRRVIGVDDFSQFGGPKDQAFARFETLEGPQHALFDMDYRHYFAEVHDAEIDLYFYDGEHSYQNQMKGLLSAEPYFADNCIVMVDDTNWDEPRRATLDFIAQSRNRYRILFDQCTAWNGHPTFWNGLLLFQRFA